MAADEAGSKTAEDTQMRSLKDSLQSEGVVALGFTAMGALLACGYEYGLRNVYGTPGDVIEVRLSTVILGTMIAIAGMMLPGLLWLCFPAASGRRELEKGLLSVGAVVAGVAIIAWFIKLPLDIFAT